MLRTTQFQNEYYYHIYNRGVDKRKVFLDKQDYSRFLISTQEFNQDQPIGGLSRILKDPVLREGLDPKINLVNIIAYCLNPNHFHLLLKQNTESGISNFMHKIQMGYTNYFNNKYQRSGVLWQGKYKAKEVKSTYGLIKLSVYVNCNAEIHNIAKKEEWPWSSYKKQQVKAILSEFKNIKEYIEFCNELIPEIKAIKNLEKYGLE